MSDEPSDAELAGMLCGEPWRLCFNAVLLTPGSDSGTKVMAFDSDGRVEPANHHEAGWRVRDGWLEFTEPGGRVHSRFFYHGRTDAFYSDNDPELPSRKGQFMRRAAKWGGG